MSALQEQAVRMIRRLPDNDVSFVISILARLVPNSQAPDPAAATDVERKLAAVQKLVRLGQEIRKDFPADWDPDREMLEAMEQKCRAGHRL